MVRHAKESSIFILSTDHHVNYPYITPRLTHVYMGVNHSKPSINDFHFNYSSLQISYSAIPKHYCYIYHNCPHNTSKAIIGLTHMSKHITIFLNIVTTLIIDL